MDRALLLFVMMIAVLKRDPSELRMPGGSGRKANNAPATCGGGARATLSSAATRPPFLVFF